MPQLKLTIREIADLKEGRKTLTELTKTHDGTSLGQIKGSLNSFAERYNQLDHEEASIYDENGNEIRHITQNHETEVDLNGVTQYLNENGIVNCHIDHNHPINHYKDVIPSPLSIPDMDMLRITNDEGEYIYRSISCESMNGYRMTLIRNNSFSKKDEGSFMVKTGHLNESCHAYYEEFKNISKRWSTQHMKEYYDKGYSLEEFQNECIKQTINELGTFEDFIFKERGYGRSFEECNCKLRITKLS